MRDDGGRLRVIIRSVLPVDREWLGGVVRDQQVADASSLDASNVDLTAIPGFVAHVGEDRLGVISYRIAPDLYEILLLFSGRPGLGIGKALVNSVIMQANDAKCRQVMVLAKNGNPKSLSFYKSLGFKIGSVRAIIQHTTRTRLRSERAGEAPPPAGDDIEMIFPLKG